MSARSSRYLLILILLLAFALRFTGSWFGYPWLGQYDEQPELVKPALKCLDFTYSRGIPPITHNGPLCKYLLAFVFGIWGLGAKLFGGGIDLVPLLRDTTIASIVARMIIGVLAGTAGVWVIWLAGRRLAGDAAGLIAAFFLAIAFKPVEYAHYATSDVTATLVISLILLFALRYFDTGNFQDLVWAAIFWAGGVAVKLSLAAAVILILAAILIRPGLSLKDRLNVALKAAGVGLAAVLFLHLPYIGDPQNFVIPVTDLMLTAVTFYHKGFFWYFYPQIYPSSEIPPAGVGWMWLSIALAGMILSLLLPGRKKWILLSFALLFYCTLGLSRIKLTRYFMPLLPILAIWAGVALVRLHAWLAGRLSVVTRGIVVTAMALLFAFPSFYHAALFSWQAAGSNCVMELSSYLSANLSDSDRWFAVANIPIHDRHAVRMQSGFLNKGHYQDGVRRDLVKGNSWLSRLVAKGEPEETEPVETGIEMMPDSLHLMRGVTTIILDEYRLWDLAHITDEQALHPHDLQQARRFVQTVQRDWKLAATFSPHYNQDWGESCAGRQPKIWVYRWPSAGDTTSDSSSPKNP